MLNTFRNHWIWSCALGGTTLAVAAVAIVTATRGPAVAAPPKGASDGVEFSIAAYNALERARTLNLEQDFTAAATVLANALRGSNVSGELSDYFLLRNAQLKTIAFAGDHDAAVEGYLAWLAQSPTELLANELVNTVVLGMQRYDVLDAAAQAAANEPAAAARIAVGRLEAAIAQQDYAALANPKILVEAARLTAASPESRQLFLGLMGAVANRPGAPSPATVARSISAVIGVDQLDVNFLLNWASEEERDGDFAAAAGVLDLAEPLLANTTDEVRWHWSQANIAFAQGRLFEARQFSDLVKSIASGGEVQMPFPFEHQAHILDRLIDQAHIAGGGVGITNLIDIGGGPVVIEPIEPCHEVVVIDAD